MIFIYLDWGVMSVLKAGGHKQLLEILKQPDRFIIPYSTSHIADIFHSYKENNEEQDARINQDLEFISGLTNNSCYSCQKEEAGFMFYDPKDLFQQRVEEKDLFKNFNLDKLESMFKGDPLIEKLGKNIVESIRLIPIDQVMKDALENPEIGKYLDEILPGWKDNLTMEGFFEAFGKMIESWNESEKYKDVRKLVQNGLRINRDKLYDSENPFDLINKAYKDLGGSVTSIEYPSSFGPDWYKKIGSEFLKLDMHGYKEDKIEVKPKSKKTFKNTVEDSNHAAFSSMSHFYIVDDRRAYEKAKKVYEKLGINSHIFTVEEFLNHYNSFLYRRDPNIDLKIQIEYLKRQPISIKEIDSGKYATYYIPHFLFDFFNMMNIFYDKENHITMVTLGQSYPTNKRIIYYFEIVNLSKKLYAFFGQDSDDLGEISEEELKEEEWIGRKWEFEGISLRFNRSGGDYILYYDYHGKN